MTDIAIIKAIDEGANHYLRLFGDAEHMRVTDHGAYTVVEPRAGEQGIAFVFDIRLERLPDELAREKIQEINALPYAVWWPLRPLNSPRIARLIYGDDAAEGDERYMAVFAENFADDASAHVAIRRVDCAEDFGTWALLGNRVFADGRQDVHPTKHARWATDGRLAPYIAYVEREPVGVAAILRNGDAASLEFVAVREEYRRRGIAKALSARAVRDAFTGGVRLVTARAFAPAYLVYEALGFRTYLRG